MKFPMMVLCAAIYILILSCDHGSKPMTSSVCGYYFPKKSYVMETLPTWEASRSRLPCPVLDANPDWVDMYWKCWELAFDHLRQPAPGTPFVSNYVDEAFNNNIYQWDTIFMVMFWRYAHHIFPAAQSFDNFYCRQHNDGFICREIWETGELAGQDHHLKTSPQAINPPLFSWAETEYYRVFGDKQRFVDVLPVLEKYVEWLEVNRIDPAVKHGLYWQNGLGSGMDNTPQTGSAWVEMSAQMVIQYNDLAVMADEIGFSRKANVFRQKAKDITEKINGLMWDNDSGFYWNLDDDNNFQKCRTIGFSWTLLAGIPSPDQASRVVENLMNPELFYRHIPFASLSATSPEYNPHGGYWLGSSWAPTTYQAIKGMEKYGYEEHATQASEKYIAGMAEVFKKTETVWENYASDYPEPGDNSRKEFVGWSACGPVALLIENVIGLRPDAIHRQITWHLHRCDRHGIENLVIGETTLSLLCEVRQSNEDPAVLIVTTDRPFRLIVVHPNGQKMIDLKVGTTNITIM